MKVSVDVALCSGCGMCAVVCPEIFRMRRHRTRRYAEAHAGDAEYVAGDFFRIARECCIRNAIMIGVDARPAAPGGRGC